jgi:beta-phosphoglucomutase-like phosphatase (HAD superfamily)
VDSNDAHARAWVQAFAEHGITVAYEPVRRAIGMGGDRLMPRVSGASPRHRSSIDVTR